MPIFLADGARDEQLLTEVQNGRALFDQVRGTAPSTPAGDVYDSFAAAYASAYDPGRASDSVYTSYSYDAAWLAVYGTAWAQYQTGTIDGTGIAKGLRRVSEGDPEIIRSNSWTDVRAHFEVGQSVDVDGASGHLDYDPVTEETSGTVDIWVINADQSGFTTVDVYDPQ
jgi:branched-chain amino acid transport system substrate-binding protein